MVGRDRELARVKGLLDDALAGQGRLVLCTGEAGIGKTRLAEAAAAAAAARGVPAAWARAADRGSSPPYGLWRLVLDDPAVRGDAGRASGRTCGRRSSAAPSAAARTRAPSPASRPVRAVRRGPAAAGARRPGRPGCCWCSTTCSGRTRRRRCCWPTWSRQLRGTRILVFASYRAAPEPGAMTCCACRRRPTPSGWTCTACPPRRSGTCCCAAGLAASPEQVRRVHAETGGNPFLVRELARTLPTAAEPLAAGPGFGAGPGARGHGLPRWPS